MAGFEPRVHPVSSKTAHAFLARNRVIAEFWNPGCYDSSSNQELRVLRVIHAGVTPTLSQAISIDDPTTTHGQFWPKTMREDGKIYGPDTVVPTPTTLYGVTNINSHCLSWGLRLPDGRIRFLRPQEIASALAFPPGLHFRSSDEIPNVRYFAKIGDRG